MFVLGVLLIFGLRQNRLSLMDSLQAMDPDRAADSKNSGMDFSKITKYQIFYGTLSEKIIEDMKTSYQLVILDSLYVSPAHIESLQSAGVLVYGYISLGDIESSDLYFLNKIKPGDYLMVDGKRVHSGWNNMGDIRKTHYKSLLMENIQRRIIDKGFDGVFFDTIEYYEDTSLAGGQKNSDELVAETIQFIKKVKETYPGLSLFQNRGFKILDQGSKTYVDAVLYEDFDANNQSEDYQEIKKIINNSGVQCFVHTYSAESIQEETALAMGWKFLKTTQDDNYQVYRFD